MPIQIQMKRGLEAKRPYLSDGELYLATDSNNLYIGNGSQDPLKIIIANPDSDGTKLLGDDGSYKTLSNEGTPITISNITIDTNSWDPLTKSYTITGLVITSPDNVDFGLPVPTTRENAQEVANSKIIVSEVTTSTITLEVTTLPEIAITVCVKYY